MGYKCPNDDDVFGLFCEAFNIKPQALLSGLGMIFSGLSMLMSFAQQPYNEQDQQLLLQEYVRREVAKTNGGMRN